MAYSEKGGPPLGTTFMGQPVHISGNVLRQKIDTEIKAVLTFIVRILEELAHCENLLMGIISKLCTTEATSACCF